MLFRKLNIVELLFGLSQIKNAAKLAQQKLQNPNFDCQFIGNASTLSFKISGDIRDNKTNEKH